jgi:NADH-quinone oxidoreductase subunit L
MTIGLGALVGVPPLAGFWSKDAILYAASGAAGWVAGLVFAAGLATVVVTAWYATRLWLRTFFGARRSREAAHDPPPLMLWPLVVLAVPAALLGLAAFAETLVPWLGTPDPAGWTGEYPPGAAAGQPVLAGQELVHLGAFMVVPLVAVAAGLALAWLPWRADRAADPARVLGPVRPVFARAFYLDEAQHALVVRPVRALARMVRRADERLVDGAVEGAGRGTMSLGERLARVHRAGLPRAAAAVVAGALLLGAAAVLLGGVR